MAEKKGAPIAGRKELNPLVYQGEIQKETLRQRQFGLMWGEICKSEVPKTMEEAIEAKQRELQRLQEEAMSKTGHKPAALLSQTTQGEFDESARKPDPEAGLKKGFRILRAGV